MRSSAALALLLASTAFAPAAVLAVEPPADNFLLWSAIGATQDRDAKAILNLDIDPGTPGIETLGLAQGCAISSRDAEGRIIATYRVRLSARDAQGVEPLFTMSALQASTVISGRFPDPQLARYQCGGANETRYEVDGDGEDLGVPDPLPGQAPDCNFSSGAFQDDIAASLCDELPQVFNIGAGIANHGAARYLVLGSAVRGNYINNLDGGVDFSRFNVAVYDTAGARVFSKTFGPVDVGGYELAWELASVGDYLPNGAGVDEIRLVYMSGGDASFRIKYTYYDIETGRLIQPVVVVSTPCPGPCAGN